MITRGLSENKREVIVQTQPRPISFGHAENGAAVCMNHFEIIFLIFAGILVLSAFSLLYYKVEVSFNQSLKVNKIWRFFHETNDFRETDFYFCVSIVKSRNRIVVVKF